MFSVVFVRSFVYNIIMPRKLTKEQFIEKAKKVHGNFYDYSKVDYINKSTNIKIVCPNHGLFKQSPEVHLRGHGCPACGGTKKLSAKDFIKRAKKVHGNSYNYSYVDYKNNRTKVRIICPEHGEFQQTPEVHLRGHGCPACSDKEKMTNKTFVKKAIKVHSQKNIKYDYSKVNYINNSTKVCIICEKDNHGEFWQTPHAHLSGQGCPKCFQKKNKGLKQFLKDAKKVHGKKYDYSKVKWKNNDSKIEIICHEKDANGVEHGLFFQTPHSHLCNHGCPKCSRQKNIVTNSSSKPENYLNEKLIEKFGRNNVLRNIDSDPRYPFMCDFYIPKLDLFIEFNGWWMHSNEWYDGRSNISKEKVELWKSKNSRQYVRAIKTYTKEDVLKRKTAKKNNLNYVVLWNEQDIEDWFALGCPNGHDGDGMYTWRKDNE